MVYFFRKKLKNKYYLFKGENKFVNGQSIRTKSKYIGSFEELSDYFQNAEAVVQYQTHSEFGLSRAIYDLVKQLGLIQILTNHLKKRTKDDQLPMRVALMVINRIIQPCAKYSIENWYSKSDLSYTLDLPCEELASQKIYRSMDLLDRHSEEIEIALCKVISAQENVSFKTLYLDFTNQETFSRNHESIILKNGLNKRGRKDLYQVNISLCCDVESGIPFFHKVYPGNWNDKQFIKSYVSELRNKLRCTGYIGRNLLVIDRGINGQDNFNLLNNHDFDYVGGLLEQFFPDYFAMNKSSLRNTYSKKRKNKENLTVTYTSVEEEIYGRPHRVVVCFNPENKQDKSEKVNREIQRHKSFCEAELEKFKEEIAERTFESRWNNIKKIQDYLTKKTKKWHKFIGIEIQLNRFQLSWKITINEDKIKEHLANAGKFVLFTNRMDLSPREIVNLYHEKDKIEKNFQFLKSNAYTSRKIILGPMLHSKDKRIESHVYTCIMALQLYQILRNRLSNTKIEMSTQEVLDELTQVSCYYTKIAGKEEAIRHINELTDLQKRVLKALNVQILK
jgi:transposase